MNKHTLQKIYEWYLTKNNTLVSQGVLTAQSKKDAEAYLKRSLSIADKEKLEIKLLK
jgi:hypothetical protein